MKTFLTAEWRNLLVLNFEIDPAILKPRIPAGTELDDFHGRHFVSAVGFQFLHTRVLGLPIPFHRNFPEVNLRFYVRRKHEGEWRRGVVFVRELVPRFAIAFVARQLYGEPYLSLPMRAEVDPTFTRYSWRRKGIWESLSAKTVAPPAEISPGSEEEFILEHYWGYTAHGTRRTSEYEVTHPRWKVATVSEPTIDAEISTLYGPEFAQPLSEAPASAFLAEGSPITVKKGATLKLPA